MSSFEEIITTQSTRPASSYPRVRLEKMQIRDSLKNQAGQMDIDEALRQVQLHTAATNA